MEANPNQSNTENKAKKDEDDDYFFGIEKHGDMTEEEFEGHLNYLKNHPLFMKDIPEDISQNENLQALQNLIFNDEPENIANYCNEKGNSTWKKGQNEKYYLREAIKSYEEGINQNFDDDQMKSKMWSNKAMMQFKLKNYRDCAQSCLTAIKLNPTFIKPYYRCGMSYYVISRYQESLDIINQGLKIEKNDELQNLQQKVLKKIEEIQEKETQSKNLELIKKNQLYSDLVSKNIVLGKQTLEIPGAYQVFISLLFKLIKQTIFVDENKKVHTPICLLYPEFQQMDFIQDSIEDDLLINQLEIALQEGLPWEQGNQEKFYTDLKDIIVFTELNSTEPFYQLPKIKKSNKKGFYKVNQSDTILTILQIKHHIIPMTLQLYILSRKSQFYNIFISQNDIIQKL